MKYLADLRTYILNSRTGTVLMWVSFSGALAAAVQAATLGQWVIVFWAGCCVGWAVLFRVGQSIVEWQQEIAAAQTKIINRQQEQITELLNTLENIVRRLDENRPCDE